MILYSKTIQSFISRLLTYSKEILEEEVGAKFFRTRFLYNKYYYPLNFVVFEKKNLLGYFEAGTFRIGINKSLMYQAKEKVLKDIIRHELAHYLCHIHYPNAPHPHGEEFKSVCHLFNWDSDVSDAKIELMETNEQITGDLQSEALMTKVKKLLTLASSDNPHEAELATLKANQLILKHNLQFVDTSTSFEDVLYTERVYSAVRNSAKMQAVYEILKQFMVYPVFNYGKDQVYLEVSGSKLNVEIAEYVSTFLERELENLWLHNKQLHGLSGKIAKNSFFQGVSVGYKQKQNEFKDAQEPLMLKQLIKIEAELFSQVREFYPRLGSITQDRQQDVKSLLKGTLAGKNLSIKTGLGGKLAKLITR